MPVGLFALAPSASNPSAGIVLLWFVRSAQEPVSSSTTCTPPPFEVLRVPPRGREIGGGGLTRCGKRSIVGTGGGVVVTCSRVGKYSELAEIEVAVLSAGMGGDPGREMEPARCNVS